MQTRVGEVLILRLVEARSSNHETVLYKVESENFEGKKYNNPVISGRFIEVEIMRNFRVSEKKSLQIEELDAEVKE